MNKGILENGKYSKLQQVASAISGYEFNDFSNARDDYYYELETKEEKLEQIMNYACNALDINLNNKEILRVYDFLESEYENANEKARAFLEL